MSKADKMCRLINKIMHDFMALVLWQSYLLIIVYRYEVQEYGNEVNEWFTTAIARPCVLVRCHSFKYQDCIKKGDRENACRDVKTKLNFVNEAQLLLISLDSIGDLNSRIRSSTPSINSIFPRILRYFPLQSWWMPVEWLNPWVIWSWRNLF